MVTTGSFCSMVWGLSYSDVCQRIAKDDYKQFEIPKKGGTRTINYVEKGSELWTLQHSLLRRFLEKQPLPPCAKGFRRGGSYRSFLSEHIGAKFFLRIDIASFFPSITGERIKRELSRTLACPTAEEKDALLDLICEIVTLDGRLPQGACTSPAVSNLVMAAADRKIAAFCRKLDVHYTRYADDLLFSSKTCDVAENRRFRNKIKYILGSWDLKLNDPKMRSGQNELVLNGYVISAQEVRLSRNRLSDIRHTLAFARDYAGLNGRFVPEAFLAEANRLPLKHRDLRRCPFVSVWSFVQYMRGYRAFLLSMTDRGATPFQTGARRLIRRLDVQIDRYQAEPAAREL